MITHCGFSAWITCEGNEIVEYDMKYDNQERKATCWIPSEQGKHFVVHWEDLGGGVDTAAYLKFDGFQAPGRFLFGKGQAERSAIRVGPKLERPFFFSRVEEATDVPESPDTKQRRSNEVGTILVKIKRVKRKEARMANPPLITPNSRRRFRRSTTDSFIDFGAERPTFKQMPTTWATEPYSADEPGTFVTFEFKYRSRDFLIARGIMHPGSAIYRSNSKSPRPSPPLSQQSQQWQQMSPPMTPLLREESTLPTPASSPGFHTLRVHPTGFVSQTFPLDTPYGPSDGSPTRAVRRVTGDFIVRDETDVVVARERAHQERLYRSLPSGDKDYGELSHFRLRSPGANERHGGPPQPCETHERLGGTPPRPSKQTERPSPR